MGHEFAHEFITILTEKYFVISYDISQFGS
jgi:hypothetical protein